MEGIANRHLVGWATHPNNMCESLCVASRVRFTCELHIFSQLKSWQQCECQTRSLQSNMLEVENHSFSWMVFHSVDSFSSIMFHSVDGCEILHQLVDGLSHYSPSPIIYTFSQLPGVSLPGAGFRTHPPFQSPGSPCSHCPSAKENSCWDQPQEERTLLFGSERAPPRR